MPLCVAWCRPAGGVASGLGGLVLGAYGSSIDVPGLLRERFYRHLGLGGCRQPARTVIAMVFCGLGGDVSSCVGEGASVVAEQSACQRCSILSVRQA